MSSVARRRPARRAPQPAEVATAPPADAFVVVDGRRWRAADPSIPPGLRQELVNELMAARRAVRDAKTDAAVRAARRRVNDAKLALGERGRAWWWPASATATVRRIEAAMRALLMSRRPGRTICPSDVARIAGGPAWRSLMPVVREVAAGMSTRGDLDVLRGGRVLTRDLTAGVLRYRRRSAAGGPSGGTSGGASGGANGRRRRR